MHTSQYRCPYCASEDIAKLSVIYSQGVARMHGSISRPGDFTGLNQWNMDGTSQSLASANAQPPPTPFTTIFEWGCALILGSGLMLLANSTAYFASKQSLFWGGFLQWSVWLFLGGWMVFVSIYSVMAIITYPSDRARWSNSYYCRRCDTAFFL